MLIILLATYVYFLLHALALTVEIAYFFLLLLLISDLISIVVGCYFAFFICITIIYVSSIDLSWRFTGLSMRRERLHMSPQARA